MKKRFLLILCLAICLLAAGCSGGSGSDGAQGAQGDAQATADLPALDVDAATLPPDEELVETVDPSFYDYRQLDYSNGAVLLDYPAHWNRAPGTNTICYVEPVEDGDTPARFALTKKAFESAPSDEAKSDQLDSFVKRVVAEYDSYEVSPTGKDGSFLGDSSAYYATYTAVKGDIIIKGYVLMARRDTALYVYHFRASEDDYEAFGPVMEHIKGSIVIR